jgi:ABC-type bacteriocin/lantibiotic exporter with double-glycine peptidase domain
LAGGPKFSREVDLKLKIFFSFKTIGFRKMLQKIKNFLTQKKKETKLGLIMGVLIPTLLNIYGVVLFLRVGVIGIFFLIITKLDKLDYG